MAIAEPPRAGRDPRTPARRSAPSGTGARVGTHGTATVFAFYPNKQMTTGEGGMIVTDDSRHRRGPCGA